MSKEKRKTIIVAASIGTSCLGVIVLVFLAWNYTEAIKEQNAIERERIESDERMQKAELEQRRLETEQQQTQAAADAEAALIEKYRDECKEVQDENQAQYEKFINSCTQYNTIDFCMNSEVGQLYANDFAPDTIQNCIDSKMKTGW